MTVELDEHGRALRPHAHADTRFLAGSVPGLANACGPVERPGPPTAARSERREPVRGTARNAVLYFDPDGGGTDARVLILLEAPGPKSVEPLGSGIIAPDNATRPPTPRRLNNAFTLARREVDGSDERRL